MAYLLLEGARDAQCGNTHKRAAYGNLQETEAKQVHLRRVIL